MTEHEYWRHRADLDAEEHKARMVAIEAVKDAALMALWQWDEAGRGARMRG